MTRAKATGTTARIEELARLCIWEGQVKRSRVMHLYALGAVRASERIRELRDQFPRLLRWDARGRRYTVTEYAFRKWEAHEAPFTGADTGFARYLTDNASFTSASPLHSPLPDLSPPTPRVFAVLHQAICDQQPVEITYRSMGRPEPHSRHLEPRVLVRAGPRWHVRAFCRNTGDFRDYSLGRIVAARLLQEPLTAGALPDVAWDTQVSVRLAPHPLLTDAQADVVRFEHFRDTAERIELCRGSLVHYLVQHVRAATDPEAQLPPEYQLVVTNIEELRSWLFPS